MLRHLYISFASAFVLAPLFSIAQKYTFAESQSDIPFGIRNLYATSDAGYLSVNFPSFDDHMVPTVSLLDRTLHLTYDKPLAPLKSHYCLTSLYNGKKLLVFSPDNNQHETSYEVNTQDGSISGNGVSVFSFQGKPDELSGEAYSGASPDSSHYYVFCRTSERPYDNTYFSGAVFDQNLNVISTFSFSFAFDTYENHYASVSKIVASMSNEGYLNFLLKTFDKKYSKDNYVPFHYTVSQVDLKGKVKNMPLTGLPAGNLQAVSCYSYGNKLDITGLLQKDEKQGFADMISATITPSGNSISDAQDIAIDPAKKGLPVTTQLNTTFRLPDGSQEIVYEQRSGDAYTSHYASSISSVRSTASYSMATYMVGQCYIVRLTPAHQVQWLVVTTKEQYENDFDLHLGSSCIIDKQQGIHMIYYDVTTNPEVDPVGRSHWISLPGKEKEGGYLRMTSIYITPEGKARKIFLEDGKEGSKYEFSPKMSVFLQPGRLVYVAIKTNGGRTDGARLNDASYHIGTITVN